MSADDVMRFMKGFQETIEKSMNGIGAEIKNKIEEKLTSLDKGLDILTLEVRSNDLKQDENHRKLESQQESNMKKLEARLSKLETDTSRMKFARTKTNSKYLNGNPDDLFKKDGRLQNNSPNGFHREGYKETGKQTDKNTDNPRKESMNEVFEEQTDPLQLSPDNRIERTTSWAEEVEQNLRFGSPNTAAEDRNQWTGNRRDPSSWAARLNSDISGAAEQVGTKKPLHRQSRSPARQTPAARKNLDHQCKQTRIEKMHYWFGDSSSEDSDMDEKTENWSKVDREGRKFQRQKRSIDKKNRKIAELSLKARQMAGIGPITEADINYYMRDPKDYTKAKIHAVKAHLYKHYRYNNEELKDLNILETERNSKDNIIYIALSDERDVKDIYARKAEVRSENTIVKSYIPPQYYDRFAALNRVCAQKREEDPTLKTQIRFGERDLIILLKKKGSNDPYRMENLQSFMEDEELPPINMNLKWKFNEDRPQRRRVATPSRSRSRSPDPASRQNTATTRQMSASSSEGVTETKRRKLANQHGFPAAQKNSMDITL